MNGQESLRDLCSVWKTERPETPIPASLPTGQQGKLKFITPECHKSLEIWIARIFEGDIDLSEKLQYAEWKKHVFGNFLPLMLELLAGGKDHRDFESNLKRRLKSTAIDELLQARVFFFPLTFAKKPLSQDIDLGLVKILSYDSACAELNKLPSDTEDKKMFLNSAREILKEWKQTATGCAKVSIKDIGLAKSEQWARATAKFVLSSLLLPVRRNSLCATGMCDEIQPMRRRSKFYLAESLSSISSEYLDWQQFEDGNVIALEEGEYSREWMGLVSSIAARHLNKSLESTNNWKLIGLGNTWLTAIHWFHRATNSSLDFEAVMQLGICLDTLCNGGKLGGIVKLVCAITGWEPNDQIFKHDSQKVKNFLREIYNNGRSRIAHGTTDVIRNDYSYLRSSGLPIAQDILISYGWHLIDFNKSADVIDKYENLIHFIQMKR